MTVRVAITVPRASQLRLFRHFAERLAERFGSDIAPLPMWRTLVRAFHGQDRDILRPVVRLTCKTRRVFVSRLADGRLLFVVMDCDIGLPVTVLCEGMTVRTEKRGRMTLGGASYGLC